MKTRESKTDLFSNDIDSRTRIQSSTSLTVSDGRLRFILSRWLASEGMSADLQNSFKLDG